MNIVGIIPARMGSTRFPGKPMAKILGMPMIEHVLRRSDLCKHLHGNWVATCDREIFNYIKKIGGNAIMTADTHERASDRAAEAMEQIEKETGKTVDYAAMIQGDEPMLYPEMLTELTKPVIDGENPHVVNLVEKISNLEEFHSANTVKVVLDTHSQIMYFSREPIPSQKKYSKAVPMLKQLGLILFSRKALREFAELKPTQLEIIESVDMNRFLERGVKIRAVLTDYQTHSVDTPEDLAHVDGLMKADRCAKSYLP